MKDLLDAEDFEADVTGFDAEDFEGFGDGATSFEDGFDGEGVLDGEDFLNGIDEWGFLRKIGRGVSKVARAALPIAKTFAPIAGKAIGMALGGPAGAALGGVLGSAVRNLEDEYDGYDALDGYDGEADSEDEMDADRLYVVDALDEETAAKLAHVAAKSRKPSEAGALAAASAATLASKAPPKVKAVMPVIGAASSNVAQAMTKAGRAAVLKKTLPAIQHKTIATLATKAAKGKPVTPATARRVMAKQADRVLRSQGEIAKALAKNEVKRRSLDKKAVMRAERFDAL